MSEERFMVLSPSMMADLMQPVTDEDFDLWDLEYEWENMTLGQPDE